MEMLGRMVPTWSGKQKACMGIEGEADHPGPGTLDERPTGFMRFSTAWFHEVSESKSDNLGNDNGPRIRECPSACAVAIRRHR